MVKFRGIEICIISQFDICKLPEFEWRPEPRASDPFQASNMHENSPSFPYPTASCYVPIYPGSQIWFEYTVDGPHPPGAAYFFKMFVNGQSVIAWDCTARHGFHGKMMYNLVKEGTDPLTGESLVRRQALRFGDGLEEGERSGLDEDLIQINVYRIEYRKRMRDLRQGLGLVDIDSNSADGLRLTDSGLLEPGFRPRRYEYQLLDPIDMPYAAFRFSCRPYEFLVERGIARLRDCSSPCSPASSVASPIPDHRLNWTEAESDQPGPEGREWPSTNLHSQDTAGFSPVKKESADVSSERHANLLTNPASTTSNIPLSDSDDSLSVKTKDSIEELPSSVTRSPKSPRSPGKGLLHKMGKAEAEMPLSPTRSPKSARHRLKKKLTVKINGADFDIETKKRPLSPFTSTGVLRKMLPQTAPATVTEFGPTVEDEIRAQIDTAKSDIAVKQTVRKTTSAERGGKKLMGFLGRRLAVE